MLTLASRFILELIGIVAVASWGLGFPDASWRIAIALVATLTLIVGWWLVVAPKAANPLGLRTRQLIGTAILLLAAAGVATTGHTLPATLFAAAVIVNQLLLLVLNPEIPVRPAGLADHQA